MGTRGVLERLGIYGCAGIEDPVLAAIAMGDPALLIGSPGSAKTALAQRLAEALAMRFHAYDASKAMFEDIVGFPDPRSMQDGRVTYLQTPATAWDKEFILVDELSRANVGMQNKWLEVIRSRRVMGVHLPCLKVVIAAMNPPGMLGTGPLDEALAGRFVFIIVVPEVREMSPDDRLRVIEHRSGDDAVGLGRIEQGRPLRLGPLIKRIRAAWPLAEKMAGKTASAYADKAGAFFDNHDVHLDGRRLGMIRRGLVALVAVRLARPGGRAGPGRAAEALRQGLDRTVLDGLFRRGLDVMLPFQAVGRSVSRLHIDAAHSFALSAVYGVERRLFPRRNMVAAARSLFGGQAEADPDRGALLVTRIVSVVERPTEMETALQAASALVVLCSRPDLLARLEPDARHRLLCCWREAVAVQRDEVADLNESLADPGGDTALPARVHAVVLRIALTVAGRMGRHPVGHSRAEDFAQRMIALVEEGVAA